jgi:LPS O-antigen subunit length determinant protein (WzzB/FepE family)
MHSQFYEGGALGNAGLIPTDPEKQQARHKEVREGFASRFRSNAQRFRDTLAEFYGKEHAAKVTHAEAFEICEYGRQPAKEELRKLFPVGK